MTLQTSERNWQFQTYLGIKLYQNVKSEKT